MRKIFGAALGTAAFSASGAWAHPGHGEGGGSFNPVHYLTEPIHLVVGVLFLLGIAGIALLAWKMKRGSFD